MDRGTRLFWILVAFLLGSSAFFGVRAEGRRRELQRGTAAVVSTGEAVRLQRVVDGDSLIATTERLERVSVRLVGIKAFSASNSKASTSAFGRAAVDELARMLDGELAVVQVVEPGRDRHGRVLARLFVDERDVGLNLIERGLVLHYDAHPFEGSEAYARAQHLAHAGRRGLWADPDVAAVAEQLLSQWREEAP